METTKKNRKPREKTKSGKVMSLLTLLNPGESFYTEMPPKNVMAYSSIAKVKCSTDIVLVIENHNTDHPVTKRITKVTLLPSALKSDFIISVTKTKCDTTNPHIHVVNLNRINSKKNG